MQALSSKRSFLEIRDEGSFLGMVEMCSFKSLFNRELNSTMEQDELRIFGFPANPFIPNHLEYIPNPNAFLPILDLQQKEWYLRIACNIFWQSK